MADNGTPHRVVDDILDGLAGGAQGLVSGIVGGITGAGEAVQRGLDAPFKAVGGMEQPLRIVDRALDGSLHATEHVINEGLIGSLKMEGESVAHALDHPNEQFGIPPGMGSAMGRGFNPANMRGKMPRMPWAR